MTFRDSPWPDGTPCWADFMSPDPARAKAFYGSLFGWEFDEAGPEYGNYLTARLDGRAVAGLGGLPPGQEGMPALWTTHLAVSEMDDKIADLGAAGGQVVLPPMQVGDQGTMAVAADPTGAVFGLWQAGAHIGAEVANVPGALTWNQCMTVDVPAAKAFYANVFGYTFDDLSGPDFSYFTLAVNGAVVGGLGGPPFDGGPSHWDCVFAVADADASVARLTNAGGVVLSPAADTPYGRMAAVADDQGAAFQLVAPNDETRARADTEPASATR